MGQAVRNCEQPARTRQLAFAALYGADAPLPKLAPCCGTVFSWGAALSDSVVVAGGSATDRTVEGKDDLIEGAGFAATIERAGLEVIGVGGTATSNTEEGGLEMGSASSTIIEVGGAAYVASGGADNATTVESTGPMAVLSEGIVGT